MYKWSGFTQPIHRKQSTKQRSAISSVIIGTQSIQAKCHKHSDLNSILLLLFVMLEHPGKLNNFFLRAVFLVFLSVDEDSFNINLENTLKSHPSLPHTIKESMDTLYRNKFIGSSISCQTLESGICQERKVIGWGSFQCNQNHSFYNWEVCEINVFFSILFKRNLLCGQLPFEWY